MAKHKKFPCSVVALLMLSQLAIATPRLYRDAERRHGIPESLLYAIALSESGTTLATGQYVPWPWTLNVGGEPRFFRTRKEAWLNFEKLRKSGKRNIDVGAAQINWRWNGNRFTDSWSALNPKTNVETAARILKECYQRKYSWVDAVGCYHSPGNQTRALEYAKRVYKKWEKL